MPCVGRQAQREQDAGQDRAAPHVPESADAGTSHLGVEGCRGTYAGTEAGGLWCGQAEVQNIQDNAEWANHTPVKQCHELSEAKFMDSDGVDTHSRSCSWYHHMMEQVRTREQERASEGKSEGEWERETARHGGGGKERAGEGEKGGRGEGEQRRERERVSERRVRVCLCDK